MGQTLDGSDLQAVETFWVDGMESHLDASQSQPLGSLDSGILCFFFQGSSLSKAKSVSLGDFLFKFPWAEVIVFFDVMSLLPPLLP